MNGKSGILTGYFKETSISFVEAYDILSILKIMKSEQKMSISIKNYIKHIINQIKMIKVIAKAFRKNSSFALTAISYNFSAQLQTTSFPYAIGGLKNVPYTQSIGSLVTINELFGNDTL